MLKNTIPITASKPKKNKPKKKRLIEKLRLKYPRLERTDEVTPISDENKKYYLSKESAELFSLTKALDGQGYVKAYETGFNSLFGLCLDQVIYRSLKAVYGPPDILVIKSLEKVISEKEKKIDMRAAAFEWGYLLKCEDSCIEIRNKLSDDEIKVAIWVLSEEKPRKLPEKIAKEAGLFFGSLYALVRIFDNDYFIKEEEEKAGAGKALSRLFTNIYYQNIQGGKDILELSKEFVSEIEESRLDLLSKGQWKGASDVHRKGSILYVSAIAFSLMALEGFLNILYKLLLKPQFKYKDYERAVLRSDLDLRMLHLPVYCRGFQGADITPEDDCYRLWLKIRPFRNNLFHANLTKDHEFQFTMEDGFLFAYNPLFRMTKKRKKQLHTQHLYIRLEDAVYVLVTVEKIVNAIIEKMDDKEKYWVRGWVDNLNISPLSN